ncbi:hypothetical protein [Sphingobacterium sp. IITKGP-BTPF85]|uniref:hypothetical protein n=1 Tax=Sphingobacterium sp. IITKGP-BTPF85 TaxID=1338009 RepID=UPI000389DF91|nr:hypothetical protein [Sphingobacterium sp. IITKGP-BTPF85]KKX47497.1 hypothetical protein L950_0226230 [Sphingobacterium sp. IITKGP-BTPF85]
MREVNIDEEDNLSINFIDIKHIQLNDICLFLSNYIESPLFAMSNYFIEYLCQQCAYSPLDAIKLFNLAFEKRRLNNSLIKGAYKLDESYIKFIVGAYDSLTLKNVEHFTARKKLLLRFDEVLQDYKLRRTADKILDRLT